MKFTINITNKIAVPVNAPEIICGNSGYVIDFVFDAEWDEYAIKTARFTYKLNGRNVYKETVFTGTECKMPVLSNIDEVYVGVYAGDLTTTTPAKLTCKKSILCSTSNHDAPEEDVYNQIINLLQNNFPVEAAIRANEATEQLTEQADDIEEFVGNFTKETNLKLNGHEKIINKLAENLKVVVGSYEGDGNCGENYPTVVTFESKPHCILFYSSLGILMFRGQTGTGFIGGGSNPDLHITWLDNGVSFYTTSGYAYAQANMAGTNYYVAFLEQNLQ